MEIVGIASVAAITVIAYLIGQAVKATNLGNKWIPIICGVAGGVLGALAMKIMPQYSPRNSPSSSGDILVIS